MGEGGYVIFNPEHSLQQIPVTWTPDNKRIYIIPVVQPSKLYEDEMFWNKIDVLLKGTCYYCPDTVELINATKEKRKSAGLRTLHFV